MFLHAFHPVCEYFCGSDPSIQTWVTCERGANGNWDASCMSGVASWAVFLRNASMLESAAASFENGRGNGRLDHYVYPSGQAQESGRDQGHTQDGLEHLLETALAYWKATGDPRLLQRQHFLLRRGLEYTARYNLNVSVPFEYRCDVYNISCWHNISAKGRGEFTHMWEMAAAVYGDDAPYTQKVRYLPGYAPEGCAPPAIGDVHCGDGPPGQGTLTFYGMKPPQWGKFSL